ncbi:hypothetical protein BCR39DRAFT_292189 [Naematelia encephala]|uniref:Uncharacterized protein n=1 Tax=Naematelia encephala TaxID=71784 RepID=A0A1Y2ARQ8_9TREE|nr:hypothetical protein BCR39DRAFT_292189 [Naematelia encephala]
MGSGASKSARRLPTTIPTTIRSTTIPTPTPTPAPAPTPASTPAGPYDPIASAHPPASAGDVGGSDAVMSQYGGRGQDGGDASVPGRSRPGFSGEKDAAVLRDGMDPQFASNLSRLGQVAIHDAGLFMRTPSAAQRTLSARQQASSSSSSSSTSSSTSQNQQQLLTTTLLISLLDNLKELPPGSDPTHLYKKFGVDQSLIGEVRKWVNSPSIGDEIVLVDEGEEQKFLPAIWVDAADMAEKPSR